MDTEVILVSKISLMMMMILFDFFSVFDEPNDMLYLVMERGETDLASFFRNSTDPLEMPLEIKLFWIRMLRAVQVLHQHGKWFIL
jgi:serine/threonine protein kinase